MRLNPALSAADANTKLVTIHNELGSLHQHIDNLYTELEESCWFENHAFEVIEDLERIARGDEWAPVLERIVTVIENALEGAPGMVRLHKGTQRTLETVCAPHLPLQFCQAFDALALVDSKGPANAPEAPLAELPNLCDLLSKAGFHSCYSANLGGVEGDNSGVFTIVRKQSEPLTVRESLRLEKGARLIGLAVERHRVLSELQRSERHFRTLVVNSKVAICRVDPAGRIVYANPAWRNLTGLRPEDSPGGLDIFRLFPATHHPILENLLRQRKLGMSTSCEAVLRGQDKQLLLTGGPLIAADGTFEGSLESWTVSSDQQLRFLYERLAAAIEQSSEGVLIVDAHGQIEYCNAALTRSLGFTPEELQGLPVQTVLTPEVSFAHITDIIARTNSWSGQLKATCRNGAAYVGEAVISKVRPLVGTGENLLVSCRDVTREVILQEQVIMSQKMEALGLLAGGVAHDFNNLLQVIEGFASLCMDPEMSQEERVSLLEDVVQASERAGQLTRRLLSFARRQPMQKAIVDLNEVVQSLMRMVERLIGPHIRVQWSPAERTVPVSADAAQVEQILLNLCVNARDAMPGGGLLNVRVQSHATSTLCSFPGPCAILEVSDTGTGMTPETVQRIFEPFFTTKPAGQGTGLGLSVVYGIVQQHDGSLDVDSRPGQGTTMRVFLPLERVEPAASPLPPSVQAGARKVNILVVDDEPKLLSLARRILEKAGHRVWTACNGLDAEKVFRENLDAVDVVVLDLIMPRQGGLETWQHLEELRPGLPVLFCSGYAEEAHYSIPELSHVALLQKPYSPAQLIDNLNRLTRVSH